MHHISELLKAASNYALYFVFSLSLDCKNFSSSQFGKMFGPDIAYRVVKKWGIFCGQCRRSGSEFCRFRLQFGFNESGRCCHIKTEFIFTYIIIHSEEIIDQGCISADETQYLVKMGTNLMPVAKAREVMRVKFSTRDYAVFFHNIFRKVWMLNSGMILTTLQSLQPWAATNFVTEMFMTLRLPKIYESQTL